MLIGTSSKFILVSILLLVMGTSCCAASVQNNSSLGNKGIEKAETGVGDLVADSIRAELSSDIALIAASELKETENPFPTGTLTSDEIAVLVSYPDDPLAELGVTGKTVRQALERAVSIYPQPSLGFLQVSGLDFTFDPSKKMGERVTSVSVGGTPIIDRRVYSVVVTNSMANGALGYWKVWSAGDIKRRYPDHSIVKSIADFFESKKTIDYGTLNRITVAK